MYACEVMEAVHLSWCNVWQVLLHFLAVIVKTSTVVPYIESSVS